MKKSPLYRSIFVWYRGLRKLDPFGLTCIKLAFGLYQMEKMEKRRLGRVIA